MADRDAIPWDERLRLDVVYVDSWSVRGDLSIIWRTVRAVALREGISAEGEATMTRFRG